MNLKTIRQLHLYLGTLFAPCILFFALSGALQVFRFHEADKGGTYRPPAWIVAMASVHKDEELPGSPKAAPSREVGGANAAPTPDKSATSGKPAAPGHRPSIPLRWYLLFMAIGLSFTTVLGIMMAFRYNRDKRIVWGLLVAGTVLPIVALYL